MKRAAQWPKGHPNRLLRWPDWFIAPCSRCGLEVVHDSSGNPLHMHRYSALCTRLAAKRAVGGK